MAVLKAHDVDRFLSRPDPAVKAVLIYGPDTGGVLECARKVTRAFAGSLDDPFNVIRLNDQAVSEDPHRLADEAQAISMMGGRRVVWISDAGAGLHKAAEAYLPFAETDSLIVGEAGELPRSSKLRALFEKSANALAVPCYQDTRQSLHDLVSKVLGGAGLTAAPDAHHRLIEILGSDRALSRSELDKLALYCAGRDTVSLEDVEAVCGDTSEQSIDMMLDAVFVGEAKQAVSQYGRLLAGGVATSRLLTMAAMHVAKLQSLSLSVNPGRNASAVVKSARPPVFFRRQPAFIRQLAIWQTPTLENAERTIQSAILQTRQYPALEPEIAERAFLSLARSAQANRIGNA